MSRSASNAGVNTTPGRVTVTINVPDQQRGPNWFSSTGVNGSHTLEYLAAGVPGYTYGKTSQASTFLDSTEYAGNLLLGLRWASSGVIEFTMSMPGAGTPFESATTLSQIPVTGDMTVVQYETSPFGAQVSIDEWVI